MHHNRYFYKRILNERRSRRVEDGSSTTVQRSSRMQQFPQSSRPNQPPRNRYNTTNQRPRNPPYSRMQHRPRNVPTTTQRWPNGQSFNNRRSQCSRRPAFTRQTTFTRQPAFTRQPTFTRQPAFTRQPVYPRQSSFHRHQNRFHNYSRRANNTRYSEHGPGHYRQSTDNGPPNDSSATTNIQVDSPRTNNNAPTSRLPRRIQIPPWSASSRFSDDGSVVQDKSVSEKSPEEREPGEISPSPTPTSSYYEKFSYPQLPKIFMR